MQTLTLKAPAKINLYLNVLNKRPDGFHNIETIFEKLDLCDEIRLSRRKQGIKIFCRHKDVPEDKTNLAYQAAQALLNKTHRSDGVEIRIIKKIPVACGLGGGSSDAASTLLGLNKLWGLGLLYSQLQAIAQKLGADIPFFLLQEVSALGRGKGGILTPLKTERRHWYVLVIPPLKVSTPEMYRALRSVLTKRPHGVKIVLRALEKGHLSALDKCSYNSFGRIIQKRYTVVQEIEKALKSSGARATLLSGSGPCVFGIAQTRKGAMDIGRRLKARKKNWQVIITRTYRTI